MDRGYFQLSSHPKHLSWFRNIIPILDNLNSETLGDSKNASLHCGDVLGNCQQSTVAMNLSSVCVSPQTEEQVEQLKSLTEYMAKVLGDKVEKVVVSQRLADSPCALVTSKFGYSANMERIMKTQVKSAAPQSNANSGAVWACK